MAPSLSTDLEDGEQGPIPGSGIWAGLASADCDLELTRLDDPSALAINQGQMPRRQGERDGLLLAGSR